MLQKSLYRRLLTCVTHQVDAGEYDVTHTNNDGQNALNFLFLHHNGSTLDPCDMRYALVRALLRQGMGWRAVDNSGRAIFHQLMWPQSSTPLGVALLQLVLLYTTIPDSTMHLDINMKNSDGETPLHCLARRRTAELRVLLSGACVWGIDFNIKDQHGKKADERAEEYAAALILTKQDEKRAALERAHLIRQFHDMQRSYFQPRLRQSISDHTSLLPELIGMVLDYMYTNAGTQRQGQG